MPRYDLECQSCFKVEERVILFADFDKPNVCKCGGQMKKLIGTVAVLNTRDSFGIGNSFKDEKSGKVIDTWGKWEKAGYMHPKDDGTLKKSTRDGILRKMDKIKYDTKKKFNVKVK